MALLLTGSAEINYLSLGYFPDGLGLSFNGESEVRDSNGGNFWFTGSGEILLLGDSDYFIKKYNYESLGDIVFSGIADIGSSWIGVKEFNFGMDFSVEELEIVFADYDSQFPASIISSSTTIYNTCGCDVIPSILYLSHNLEFGGILREFFLRNGFKLPEFINLFYDGRYGSWRNSFHFTGIADNLNSHENWNFIFEWICTNEYAEENFNSSVWKFSILVSRKNLDFDVDFDTRILILFPSSQICYDANLFGLDFKFNVNFQNQFVKTDGNLIIDVLTLHDEIGLFRSKYFSNNNLKIAISENKLGVDSEIDNINSIIPERQPQFII